MNIRQRFILLLLVFSTHFAIAAPNGRMLFDDNCAGCHGEKGLGGIGSSISKQQLANEFTDQYLKATIRNGRPGRIMPAHPDFSDAQLNAIVSYMRSWVDKTPQDLPYTLKGKADRGGGLYKTHCSSCHGIEGEGGRGTGITQSRTRSYKFMAPALNNSGFLASVSNQMMFNTISNGRIEYGMPAFDILSETDKADLIAYIRQWSTIDKAKTKPAKEKEIQSIATIVESPYSFEKTIENFKESIHGKNYQIFPDRFIEQGLLSKDDVNPKQVAIRVCNFKRLYQLLNIEPRLGVILPCRITVIEDEDGKVKIIAPNINLASKVFNNDQLGSIFKELNDDLEEIIEEATL